MLVSIILSVLLIFSFYTDNKHRALPVWLLIVTSAFAFIWSYNRYAFLYTHEYIINIMFMLFLLLGMMAFWKLKHKPLGSFFSNAFGLADAWIMALWAFTLQPTMFLANVIIGSITALLLTIIFRWKTIPLAGVWCLCFTLFVIISELKII